jgi:phosphoribosylanthranilate isomerase
MSSLMSEIQAKICGLTTPAMVHASLDAGAAFIGFMIYPKSPRYIEPKAARALAQLANGRAKTVAIVVDPNDALIEAVLTDLAPDFIQLHGQETPQFCAALRARGVGVIKVFGISTQDDLMPIGAYKGSVDMVLFDAKPPKDASRPGGLGEPFDWNILKGFKSKLPWMLSGGLNPTNVRLACAATGAKMVDVSSGVESAPGLKDSALIAAFMAALNSDT